MKTEFLPTSLKLSQSWSDLSFRPFFFKKFFFNIDESLKWHEALTFYTATLGNIRNSCKHIQKSSSESHIYLTRDKQAGTCKSANGFHFAVGLFIYWSQMTSWRFNSKNVANDVQSSSSPMFLWDQTYGNMAPIKKAKLFNW